jgi:hypothetical protein
MKHILDIAWQTLVVVAWVWLGTVLISDIIKFLRGGRKPTYNLRLKIGGEDGDEYEANNMADMEALLEAAAEHYVREDALSAYDANSSPAATPLESADNKTVLN